VRAEVAVQPLEGGEAVVFSHGSVVRGPGALCAGHWGAAAAGAGVFAWLRVFFLGRSQSLPLATRLGARTTERRQLPSRRTPAQAPQPPRRVHGKLRERVQQ
jgi:hypothetical protein